MDLKISFFLYDKASKIFDKHDENPAKVASCIFYGPGAFHVTYHVLA